MNRKSYRFMTFIKLLFFNIFGLYMVYLAWLNGLVEPVFENDMTKITYVIVFVFLIGFVGVLLRNFRLSRELNALDDYQKGIIDKDNSYHSMKFLELARETCTDNSFLQEAFRSKLLDRVREIRWIAALLVVLGLIGTVFGILIALSGVDATSAGDVSSVGRMVARLINGMHVALYTTILGSILSVWHEINVMITEKLTVRLYTRTLELVGRT